MASIALLQTLEEMTTATKERLFDLNRQRNSIEEEMAALVEDLRSPRGDNNFVVGLPGEGRLIDDQGFPRADIDLYDVRTKRHRYVCLQTDHKELMARLETELKALHRVQLEINKLQPPPQPNQPSPSPSPSPVLPSSIETTDRFSSANADAPAPETSRRPFAKVESVAVDCPADKAGLKIGDSILSFGTEEFTLTNLATLVHENEPVSVVVERKGAVVQLMLVPKKWSGRGLLGCYLVPL
jgi:26S proteasome regulatory subunit N4